MSLCVAGSVVEQGKWPFLWSSFFRKCVCESCQSTASLCLKFHSHSELIKCPITSRAWKHINYRKASALCVASYKPEFIGFHTVTCLLHQCTEELDCFRSWYWYRCHFFFVMAVQLCCRQLDCWQYRTPLRQGKCLCECSHRRLSDVCCWQHEPPAVGWRRETWKLLNQFHD